MRYTAETPFASNTALPITTGCAFNRSLWRATGNQIGREARAFMNAGNAYSTYWAPVINLVRGWLLLRVCSVQQRQHLVFPCISFAVHPRRHPAPAAARAALGPQHRDRQVRTRGYAGAHR